jgi:hypothetical protein
LQGPVLRHLAGFAAFGKGFYARRNCENAGIAGIMAQGFRRGSVQTRTEGLASLTTRDEYESIKKARALIEKERAKMPWWWLRQRDPVARSTKWLVIVTVLLCITTGASVVALVITDHTLKDTAKRQLRAYVLFDSGSIQKIGDHFAVSVVIKNSGQTPAYNVTHWWSVAVLDYPLTEPPIYSDPNPDQSADIGAALQTPLGDARPLTVSSEEMQDIKDRKKAIYVIASIKYKDTFQRDQAARFIAVNLPTESETGWHMRSYLHIIPDNL